MKKDREYTKIIVTRLNAELKARFDTYCERMGLSGSEVIRCFIINLPEQEPQPPPVRERGGGEEEEAGS